MAEVPLPTPTQVPVPSTDIRNAVFAGARLDEEVTGTGEYYTDRLGVRRLTNTGRNNQFNVAQQERESRFDAFIQSSGYDVIGDYTAGPLTLTEYNQLIRYNNELYKLTAATDIPFTTAGNTDETWNNIDSAHFVSVGDSALRQALATNAAGDGSDLIQVSKTFLDIGGMLTNWLHSPSLEVFGFVVGQDADYVANCVAINNAAKWSWKMLGMPVIVPGGDNFFEGVLNLLYDSDSNRSATFRGLGDTKSYLHPIGGDGTSAAIQIVGKSAGISGSESVRSAGLSGLYINSSKWKGDTLYLENVALWSVLENIQIWYSQGRGVYGRGVTECEFNNIEVRGCVKEGWLIYEPNPTLGDPEFVECSYNIFRRAKAFANNNYGTQGRFVGGNAYLFEHCKFQEGTTGMLFDGSKGMTIIAPYFDGTTKVAGSTNRAIKFTGAGSTNNSVKGGRAWNCHIFVDLDNSSQSSVMDVNIDFSSPAGSSVYCVSYGSSNSLPSYHNTPAALDNTDKGLLRNFYDTASVSFTPTFTVSSGTVNTTDATRVGRRIKNGNRVDLSCRYTMGAGSVLNGTNITLVLPYSTTLTAQSLSVSAFDFSANKYFHGRAFITGQGAVICFDTIFTAYENSPSTANPFYPASGDWIQIEGTYLVR